MRETKKIAISAMMVALGVVFMTVGAFVSTLDLTASALTSLIVMLVFVEVGAPYIYLVWLATGALGFALFPGSAVWLEYLLVFGIYPILKAYIERTPRFLWIPIRLVYANLTFALLFWLMDVLLSMPLDMGESIFGISGMPLLVAVWVVMNIAFVVYDMLLTVSLRIYLFKYRERFKKLFK